jgi:hypothetical protein
MPYPHVIQFETLDRRRRRTLGGADVPRRAVAPTGVRRAIARPWRLRRASPCAGAI